MYRTLVQSLVLCFSCFTVGAVAQSAIDEAPACNVQVVPKEAVRLPQNGGLVTLHYPDPRSVPADYSGCLNSWAVIGNKTVPMFVSKFDKGVIQSWKMAEMNVVCNYENGQLARDKSVSASMCPPAREVTLKKWQH